MRANLIRAPHFEKGTVWVRRCCLFPSGLFARSVCTPLAKRSALAKEGSFFYAFRLSQLPKVDKIVVPVGGGGLISGIATAVKGTRDSVKVYGAEPALCARYTESFKKGEPTLVTIGDTIADGTMTAKPGEKTFPIVREKVDGIIPVEEKFIHRAVKLLLLEGKILAEPSSCMTLGAALQGALPVKEDDNVIFFLSGGNVDLSLIEKICAEK